MWFDNSSHPSVDGGFMRCTICPRPFNPYKNISFDLSFQNIDGKDLYKYKCVLVSRSVGRCRLSCPSYIKVFLFFFSLEKFLKWLEYRYCSLVFSVHLSIVKASSTYTPYVQYPIPTRGTHSFGRCNVIRSIMVHFMRFLVVRFSSLFYFLSRSPHHVHVWPYVVYAERFFCTVVVIVSREVARAG